MDCDAAYPGIGARASLVQELSALLLYLASQFEVQTHSANRCLTLLLAARTGSIWHTPHNN